ncbi:MAG: hypothetical protein ACREO0_15645 [Pseudoxanthomonas sp.]
MQRFAVLALAAFGLWPVLATAQTSSDTQQAFAFCTVTDTGSAQAKIWASPVFPFSFPRSDVAGFGRLNTVAGEFLQYIAALGGAGDKQCVSLATRAEAEAMREEQRAIWSKRVYLIKIGDWREVPWTPAPWDPVTAVAPPAQLTKYFRCYNTEVDIPDRSDLSRTVASGVFAMPVPGNEPLSMYAQANAYAEEFKQTVRAHGVADQGTMCVPHDTAAEADKAQRDYRRIFSGFNQKFIDVAWSPGAQPAAAAPSTATTPVVPTGEAPVVPPAIAAQAPAGEHFCVAFVTRSKPPLVTRTPIWKAATGQNGTEAMTRSLSAVTAAVLQANPGKWQDFPAIQCQDNSAVFAGETFCYASSYKHFSGSQLAGQFCNASRALIDKRWEDMLKSNGGAVQSFAWPRSPE